MAKHNLALHVVESLHPCMLSIQDISTYSNLIPTDCSTLQITPPGFVNSFAFTEDINFSRSYTACDLGLQNQECGSVFYDLPDGIYVIKWSIAPNDQIYVEYNHLRMVKAMTKYYEALCDLDLSANCQPDKYTADKLKELNQIRMYLESAKASVEICHEPQTGMELYNYALSLLNKFNCKTCK